MIPHQLRFNPERQWLSPVDERYPRKAGACFGSQSWVHRPSVKNSSSACATVYQASRVEIMMLQRRALVGDRGTGPTAPCTLCRRQRMGAALRVRAAHGAAELRPLGSSDIQVPGICTAE